MAQSFTIQQSLHLQGTISTYGAKNAVLVMMCSTLLTRDITELYNVPLIEDVFVLRDVLCGLGADITINKHNRSIQIDTRNVSGHIVPVELMQKMRASVLVLGPLLATIGKVQLAFPGGDAIGKRPIDYHLQNFEKMGAQCDVNGGVVHVAVKKMLRSGTFVFDYPSVGATENILMACSVLEGTSKIVNAALEPEVLDLIVLLRKMGADVRVQAPGMIYITGVKKLRGATHTVLNDRLQTGTYAIAAALTQGDVCIENADPSVHDILINKLETMGHRVEIDTGLRVIGQKNQKPYSIRTEPYPGFPTDLQAFMVVLATQSQGISTVRETVYENRFQQVPALRKMGAHIDINGRIASIHGKASLQGCSVQGNDIRAAMSLVLAGFVAQGETVVAGAEHVMRGYDDVVENFQVLGAHITKNF